MLENIVAWVLNNYIGEYLEDLNTDQLSVALLSGQVELENVPLKKTALRKLDLPVEVKSGLLGKLTLSVPIAHIRSEPWTLKLSDVLIILGPPSPDRKYDVEAVEQVEQQRKEQMLGELENRHMVEILSRMNLPIPASKDSWWSASLISTVLNNIQLILNNVHIRYEDSLTLPNDLVFSCGVRIQKITVQTTNSQWKPGFVEPLDGMNVFKKLELKGFSLYWSSDEILSKNIDSPKQLRNIMTLDDQSNAYIIQPCSAELRMEKNSSKFPLKGSSPRFKFYLRSEKITCELSRRQMAELRALNREWMRFERARQHRKWRPLNHVSTHAAEWWRFAYDRICDESRRMQSRRTWHFALTRARHLNAYCRAYRRQLLSLIGNPVDRGPQIDVNDEKRKTSSLISGGSQEDKAIMKQIERDVEYTYYELYLFRETVFRRLIRDKEREKGIDFVLNEDTFETIDVTTEDLECETMGKEEGKGLYGWFTSFFMQEENEEEKEETFDFGKLDLSELKKLPQSFNFKDMEEEILDVLYESWDDSTLLRRDLLLAEIALRLEHITLRFVDTSVVNNVEQRRVLAMDLIGVTARVELSPRQHFLSVSLSVHDMSIQRLRTGHPPPKGSSSEIDESLMYSLAESTKILLAVGRKNDDVMEKEPMFRMFYRRRSPRFITRYSIEGRFRPVSIIYEENALVELSNLFADDPAILTANDLPSSKSIEPSSANIAATESHVFINLHIPNVMMELRGHGWGNGMQSIPEWEAGEPFSCLSIYDVSLGVVSQEPYLSKIKIGFGHLELSDLLEHTSYPLLFTRKGKEGISKPFSTSCPDLVAKNVSDTSISTSLPNHSFLERYATVHGNQKISMGTEGNISEEREVYMQITFVDAKHPHFESTYQKKNCNVEIELGELEMGLNRRTWTALMDLAGLLGDQESDHNSTHYKCTVNDIKSKNSFCIECSLHVRSWYIDMHYPANGTRLGAIRFTNTELNTMIDLNDLSDTMTMILIFDGMWIDDRTPFYSQLYPERMALCDRKGVIPSKAKLELIKYFGKDSQRECDLRLRLFVPNSMHFYYVHTHRFFCGLMDFWTQFFELQDQIAKSKRCNVEDGGCSRISVDIDICCSTTLIFPLNQTSEQALVVEVSHLKMANTFQPMSSLNELLSKYSVETDYGFDSSIDCLLDYSHIILSDLRAFESVRVESSFNKEDKNTRIVGHDIFNSFAMMTSVENVFSRSFDLSINVLRNLDGLTSHNVPDLTIITGVHAVRWRITTEFYKLFRGILEKNFGDPLIPVPESIPFEILQKPMSGCEVGCDYKYATLSFRLLFEDMELDCQVPSQSHTPPATFSSQCFSPFAVIQLHSARVSFDIYIDGQSELDLICESSRLIDTRIAQPGIREKNLFPIILQPSEKVGKSRKPLLMLEAHLLMKKDEIPVVTLVLMNARVLLLHDWFNDAKKFVLLNTSFVPKFNDEPSQTHWQRGVIERTNQELLAGEQTIYFKVTLRDSDLYLLENPSLDNSFALVASTSAVLNLNDLGGDMVANLEIQSITLGWCSMQSEEATMIQCSNKFSVTVGLSVDKRENSTTVERRGLPILSHSRHQINVEINGMIGRLSYKDAHAINAILKGYVNNIKHNFGRTLIPVAVSKSQQKNIDISKLNIRSEHIDLWLLDDFQGSTIPLFRISFSNLSLDHHPDRLVSAFTISADYFNQRVFGWEPLLEKWSILRFLINTKDLIKNIELIAETKSTLDVNITEQLMQQILQLSARWTFLKSSFERDDIRNSSIRSRSDHLPYLLKNETGSDITFTTAVEDIQMARNEQRKTSVRWIMVAKDCDYTFEFPARLLFYSHCEREPPRQLIVRVTGWDEISPVNVDACGTYFRIVKAVKQGMPNARLVVRVTMEKDGKKVVVVRSSIDIHNELPHRLAVFADNSNKELITVEPSQTLAIPLSYTHAQFKVCPVGGMHVQDKADATWKNVRIVGEVLNRTQRLSTTHKDISYWICTSVRREHYPEHESLPGHSIYVVSPLTVENLLPIDVELRIQDVVFALSAGKQQMITSVDITKDLLVCVATDWMRTVSPCIITKSSIGDGRLLEIRLQDCNGRPLDMYCNVKLGIGGCISFSLWVPYWIINKSGIPLIVKQEATENEAAGQMEEHERAKDRHPLMFSFADSCPKQCQIRIGNSLVTEPGYQTHYSQRFALTPGVQALKLRVEHESLPILYYNIGVEVRAGTGRYKDTQMVLLTSRYVLNNQSSYMLSVCHHDMIERVSEHVHIAPQCSLVWNENYEDCRRMCIRRSDVRHWSCPFRIDRIGSFHVTMRDADETPRFVRVEIILSSAVFCITFTDAEYYPPQIQIDNQSDVPVLYQQQSEGITSQHLRTICKARSHVDYAWDDLYGNRRIVLQVYENKSHVYDPSFPGIGPQLVYENHVYIQLAASFNNEAMRSKQTDEYELVLETLQKGKVMLNKQNRIDGNCGNQLWSLGRDGCIENIGMKNRSRVRMVLDVLERTGYQLMMTERNSARDAYQKWTFMPDGRLCCQSFPNLMVTARRTDVCLAERDNNEEKNEDGVTVNQVWKVQRQRPGSGTLDVECQHSGPTLVVRITDREQKMRAMSAPVLTKPNEIAGVDISVTMRAGIGISLINGFHEELLYARLGGIVINARKMAGTYQLSASVDEIQIDNQLLLSDRWQILFCKPENPGGDEDGPVASDLPPGVSATVRPALKLEMNCSPMNHYDAFECFRLKLCDLSVKLDELLLWKLVHFAQATDTAFNVQQKAQNLPPTFELERPDPLRTRRWYFGTLDFEMGQIALSVATVPKSGLSRECRLLKEQFNIKLVSFENATVYLPPFRQFHYFETSSFLLESLQKFYFAELQKQTLNIIVTLDAFGNPQGLVTDLFDSCQGLFIEGDVQRFVAGLGYGVSNSISKMASSMASGVGALTFDQEHEAKRRHNMMRSHSTSSTPLTHLYSGVKGLGVGVLGGFTAILTNTIAESKKSGIVSGTIKGIPKGVVDTVTKPVQGLFDLVEGTASAMKQLAGPSTGVARRSAASGRVRPPRLCRNLYHLLPPFNIHLANAQIEMLRINGYSTKERLLDVEVCLEQFSGEDLIRQYVLISTKQCYICRQVNTDPSSVILCISYKYLKSAQPRPELGNSFASLEVLLDSDDRHSRQAHIWCGRLEVAKRLAEKMMLAKHEYDHSKRTLSEQGDL